MYNDEETNHGGGKSQSNINQNLEAIVFFIEFDILD